MNTTTDANHVVTPAAGEVAQQTALPAGVPPLTQLYLYVSGACNLACRHCWITPTFEREGKGGRYLPLAFATKAVREGLPLGLRIVKLTGGEPTLHPQFRELVDAIDSAHVSIIIETNGTLIDDDLARFLKAHAGVSFISVSVDGARPQTHDALRNVPGSFERSAAGIAALVRAGFSPQIICTLHRGNLAEVDDLLALAKAWGCGSVKFNWLQRMGRGEHFADDQGLEVPEFIAAYHHITDGRPGAAHDLPIHFDIPLAFQGIRALLNDDLGRCAVLSILGLLAGGELALCGVGVSIPELVYGNIAHDDLATVWSGSAGLLQLRQAIPAQLEGICGECLHRDFCLGECIANNYHGARKLNAPFAFCEQAAAAGLFPAARRRNSLAS